MTVPPLIGLGNVLSVLAWATAGANAGSVSAAPVASALPVNWRREKPCCHKWPCPKGWLDGRPEFTHMW